MYQTLRRVKTNTRMKKLINGVLFLALMGTAMIGCQKDDPIVETTSPLVEQTENSGMEENIKLGRQLENPYSVENMQKAYDNLKSKEALIQKSDIVIETTHYYVRYLPNSEEELGTLKDDTTLELYDYPLDFEIVQNGLHYHDPSIPTEQITWQYCVVEKDYKFEPIQYEILAELFLNKEDDESGAPKVFSGVYEQLEEESFKLTGNEEDLSSVDGKEGIQLKASKWTPSGYIKVHDDVKNALIPVRGAKVRARRWFITKTGYTNSSGYFSTGRFRRAVNYSIKWEDPEYDIRNRWSFQAYYNGPKMKNSWNLNINSGKSLRYATIHRAAYRYHYEDIGGLKRPEVWRRLKINYIDKKGTGINWGNNWQMFVPPALLGPLGIVIAPALPNIKIWGKDKNTGNYHSTNVLFSTTVHELAHASHIDLMNGITQYAQVSAQLYESWAIAVEWYITKIEYNELGVANYGNPNVGAYNRDHRQNWTGSDAIYTPLFIDLVDDHNQSLNYGSQPANKCPNGGHFDGVNCYVGTAPSGSSAFIFQDNFYYTGPNCTMSGSSFDGANCFVQNIPNSAIGFVWNNGWYLHRAGSSSYPYDQVTGYTMEQLEQLLKHSYGMTSLSNQLKANKPSGMTDKNIDVYLNYFFNL